jgi:amino acid transporter
VGRDGFALRQCGIAHSRHRILHQAVLIISAAALVMAVFLCLRGTTPFDLNGWLGTLATYGFLIAYGLACLAAPLKLRRQNSLSWRVGLVAAAALLIVSGTLWLSFDLSAPPPNNWLPFLYFGLMLAGLLASRISMRSKRVRTSSVEITAGRDV